MAEVFRCKEPFSANINGVPRALAAGDLVGGDDPVLKNRLHLFEPVGDFMERREARVEQATAEPGTRRARAKRPAARAKPQDKPSDPAVE